PHQAVRLQRMQMVVDLLPSQADPRGQRRRRGWNGQLGEESTPHGLQGHRRRRRIIDDLDVEHEEMVSLTTFFVNHGSMLFLPNSRSRWRAAELRSCGEVSSLCLLVGPMQTGVCRVSSTEAAQRPWSWGRFEAFDGNFLSPLKQLKRLPRRCL